MPVSFSPMSENARPRRRYDATKRREHAARTRATIVTAAARLFVERGYAGTTIPAIAAEAGVAVETVYRSASGKAGLLAAAVQAALAGGVERAEVPVDERPGIRRVIEETDPVRQLWLYAATQPGVWGRVGPLLRVLDAAAGSDESLAELQAKHAAQRLHGMRRFAGLLAERGALRPDVSADRAADILWTVCAQASYDSLVTDRGWAPEEYRDWIAEVLAAALLP
ncbi:MAG: TetR family transcriptional regulator [Streptosporangiales bacterium]|nr:TetR family transcriptional regulator [Streptosporangiales bacterium]